MNEYRFMILTTLGEKRMLVNIEEIVAVKEKTDDITGIKGTAILFRNGDSEIVKNPFDHIASFIIDPVKYVDNANKAKENTENKTEN